MTFCRKLLFYATRCTVFVGIMANPLVNLLLFITVWHNQQMRQYNLSFFSLYKTTSVCTFQKYLMPLLKLILKWGQTIIFLRRMWSQLSKQEVCLNCVPQHCFLLLHMSSICLSHLITVIQIPSRACLCSIHIEQPWLLNKSLMA